MVNLIRYSVSFHNERKDYSDCLMMCVLRGQYAFIFIARAKKVRYDPLGANFMANLFIICSQRKHIVTTQTACESRTQIRLHCTNDAQRGRIWVGLFRPAVHAPSYAYSHMTNVSHQHITQWLNVSWSSSFLMCCRSHVTNGIVCMQWTTDFKFCLEVRTMHSIFYYQIEKKK